MYFVCTDLGVVYGNNKSIIGIDNIDDFFSKDENIKNPQDGVVCPGWHS